MKRFKGLERGFTLMELMVVIVIVAILAAVAVPLYINYVNDARDTEAKGAIGAIVTAQQTFKQVHGGYASVTDSLNVDLTEATVNWAFTISNASPTGFRVQAAGKTGTQVATRNVFYTYPPVAGTDPWASF
jgi:prepilin-type N-terminal cleavage/methylation domain-containing protein